MYYVAMKKLNKLWNKIFGPKSRETAGISLTRSKDINIEGVKIRGFDKGIKGSDVENLRLQDVDITSKIKKKWGLLSAVEKIIVGVVVAVISAAIIKHLA